MHFLTPDRAQIEIESIDAKLTMVQGRPLLRVSSETATPLLTDAARAHFRMGSQPGAVRAAAAEAGPPPAVFRETRTGLLRMVHHEVVVRVRKGTSAKKRDALFAHANLKARKRNRLVKEQYVLHDPDRRVVAEKLVEAANTLAEMEEVEFAAPNFVSQFRRVGARKRSSSSLPKRHREQWYLENTGRYPTQVRDEDVDARSAWRYTKGKRSIVVAVLDDGVDVDHPNLRSNIRRNPDPNEPRDRCGRDFFIADESHPEHFNPRPKRFTFPFDEMTGNDIHGTPCAGVIAASGRKGGAVGVAPGCRILPVKIFHADDLAADAQVADAIRYAAVHADILSCSWSGPYSPDIDLAVRDAGVIGRDGLGSAVFCAAGNEYGSPVGFPASHPEAIAVGASTDQARLADYSNVGEEIWVVAPSSGGRRDIFTTDVGVLGRGFNIGTRQAGGEDGLHTNDFGGTSSATPLAAGVGALALSMRRSLTRDELRHVLADTTEKIGSGYDANGHSREFGYGRVNARLAVRSLR